MSKDSYINQTNEEDKVADIIAFLEGAEETQIDNVSDNEPVQRSVLGTEMISGCLGHETNLEMAFNNRTWQEKQANPNASVKSKSQELQLQGDQLASLIEEGQLATDKNSHSKMVGDLRKKLKMLEKLIQDVEENELDYPHNQESEAVVKSSIKSVEHNLQLVKRIVTLVPKCPELRSKKKNRKLKTFCASQKAILYQKYVDLGGEIGQNQCRAIAEELQVPEERVRKWFSNKKQRNRRLGRLKNDQT